MTTTSDAWRAGVDAVFADNTLNRNGFVDAIQTVLHTRFGNPEGRAWVDAIATLQFGLGYISADSYNQLRNDEILRDTAQGAQDRFDALAVGINQLPESAPAIESAQLIELRADRDSVDTSITTMQGFKTGATRQVTDALNIGIDALRTEKENLRAQIRRITGDPDA